jgi:hypothetical protein
VITRSFLHLITKPKEIRPGLTSSINASYTVGEIESILANSCLAKANVKRTWIGFEITGAKEMR